MPLDIATTTITENLKPYDNMRIYFRIIINVDNILYSSYHKTKCGTHYLLYCLVYSKLFYTHYSFGF